MMKTEEEPIYFAYDWFSPAGPIANGISGLIDTTRHHHEMKWYNDVDLPTTYGRLDYFLLSAKYSHQNISVSDLSSKPSRKAFFLIEPQRDGLPMLGLGQTDVKKSVFHFISKTAIQYLQEGRLKLLIYFANEGFNLTEKQFFKNLHSELMAWKIDPSNVVFVSGNFQEQEIYEQWIKATNCKPIQIITFPHFEYFIYLMYSQYKQELRRLPMFATAESHIQAIENNKKDKLYLCYNRLPKPSRMALGCGLESLNLLEKGLFSFPGLQEFEYINSDFSDLFSKGSDLALRLQSAKSKFVSRLPMYIDVDSLQPNWAQSSGVQQQAEFAWPYERTFFSIVNETWINNDVTFVSEKIFKPIANFHPFLLLGNPLTLKALRDLGYETFHPFIDESYDLEIDFTARFQKVLAEVERLSRLNTSEMNRLYTRLLPILRHNRNILMAPQGNNRFINFIENLRQ